MANKLLTLFFASVIVFWLSTPGFTQEGSKPDKATAAKQDRWEGRVVRTNKDKSTLAVRNIDHVVKTVRYDSSTKFTSQEHGSKKVNNIDASEVKDGDWVICRGSWDKEGALHATLISKRLTHSPGP